MRKVRISLDDVEIFEGQFSSRRAKDCDFQSVLFVDRVGLVEREDEEDTEDEENTEDVEDVENGRGGEV